jgi:NADPH oxidase
VVSIPITTGYCCPLTIAGVVEIQFSKPSLQFKPGQWLYVNVPQISYLQWHPFTIASSPYDAVHSVHIRIVGDFTRKLCETIESLGPSFRLRVDGPFGAPASDVFSYDRVVVAATGVGITPWISVLRTMLHGRNEGPRRLQRVDLVWSCSQVETSAAFIPLLRTLEKDFKCPILHFHIFITQKFTKNEAQNIMLNSAGAEEDPCTNLQERCNFGRPDYVNLMSGIKASILEEKVNNATVGVFFCGPLPVARSIRAACKENSSNHVSFVFRKEQF